MSEDFYMQTLDKAMLELTEVMGQREELDSQRDELDTRIAKLRDGIFGLTPLCGKTKDEITALRPDLFPDLIRLDVGFTEAVRKILEGNATEYLTPVQVRNELRRKGFDLSKYTNPLASIHTILKRLQDGGKVAVITREGKTLYKWRA
jgi:hypothetical protein